MGSKFFACLRRQWAGFLALFLVLTGGVAYAANTVFSSDIVDGQVKTADIGNGEVKIADIAAGAVATDEIGTNQVRSVDVRDDSLTRGGLTEADLASDSVGFNEFKFGTLPDFTSTSQASTANDTTTFKEQQAHCVGGEVVGGGYVITGTAANVFRSYAVDADSWLVRASS